MRGHGGSCRNHQGRVVHSPLRAGTSSYEASATDEQDVPSSTPGFGPTHRHRCCCRRHHTLPAYRPHCTTREGQPVAIDPRSTLHSQQAVEFTLFENLGDRGPVPASLSASARYGSTGATWCYALDIVVACTPIILVLPQSRTLMPCTAHIKGVQDPSS